MRLAATFVTLAGLCSAQARAGVLLSGDEALALAFPGCAVERTTVFLTEAQKQQAAAKAGAPIEGSIVYPYVARCGGAPGGTAYFDVHRVRTLPERLLIVIAPDGKLRRIEVLSFDEPRDYLPRKEWYAQLAGKALHDDLSLGGSIRGIAGATLSAKATLGAARRVLAIHAVLSAPHTP